MCMKNQTLGIEIETNHISRERAANVAAALLGGTLKYIGGTYDTWACVLPDGRKWKFVTDSSIPGPRSQQCEVNSPILRWEEIGKVRLLAEALRNAGAETPDGCGIHVHIGATGHTARTLRNLVNIVAAKEDLIYDAVGVTPNREQWCQKAKPDFLRELNAQKPRDMLSFFECWYDRDGSADVLACAESHYNPTRYRLLNLHAVLSKATPAARQAAVDGTGLELGTVEFRCFNSTLDPDRITAYIQFCAAINAASKSDGMASPKKPVTDNPAYAFRCWLLHLKLNGPEFAETRKILLQNMPGNAAWRNGDPTSRTQHTER